jgi:proline iminopeptidase
MRIHVNGTDLFVDVDGPQLRVEADRLVERPTILVLHGGPGFDQGYLRPGLGALNGEARVVFVDLRGQGRSGRPPLSTCTLEQMADDVAELCAQLGIDAPVLFGHSAGGFVALHLALRHPGLAGGLVLCDTAPTLAPLPDDNPPASLAERAPAESIAAAARLFGGDFSAESINTFVRLVAPYYAAPQHMDIPQHLMSLTGFAGDVASYFFSELAPRYDLRGHLSSIALPTLVIVGAHDWVCPSAASRVLAAEIPDAELVEIADAGHFPFSEEPRLFGDAVRDFLRRRLGEAMARPSMSTP